MSAPTDGVKVLQDCPVALCLSSLHPNSLSAGHRVGIGSKEVGLSSTGWRAVTEGRADRGLGLGGSSADSVFKHGRYEARHAMRALIHTIQYTGHTFTQTQSGM